MTPLDKDLVITTYQNYMLLSARIREVAIEVEKIQGGTFDPEKDYTGFDIDKDGIHTNFEHYCSGDTDYDYVDIPVEYLWMENFAEVEQARFTVERAEIIRQAVLAKQLVEQERQRLLQLAERELYERLKKKFGDA